MKRNINFCLLDAIQRIEGLKENFCFFQEGYNYDFHSKFEEVFGKVRCSFKIILSLSAALNIKFPVLLDQKQEKHFYTSHKELLVTRIECISHCFFS